MSGTSAKLKIKDGSVIMAVNAPADYEESLGALPVGAKIVSNSKFPDQLHWFVIDRKQFEKDADGMFSILQEGTICWIFFPKKTSKVQSDLNRDTLMSELSNRNLQFLTLVSFNDTWSAFGVRLKPAKGATKKESQQKRPIFDYVDPVKKTVRLPDDFAAALAKNKKQEAFFHSLSFTNKKEYVEWIITAKKEETRTKRITEALERLGKLWKNPSNR